MKTHSVKLTNGEVINDVVEVQFSACGQPMLQIDITDHATRFGIDELIKFYKGKIDHIYVWHRCNGQLCHTKVFGYESDLFDSQLDDIAKEIERAYPQNTLTITLMPQGNAGCDNCGTFDRVEGSKFCEDCKEAIERGEGVAITEQRADAKITELIRDVKDGDCALSAIFDDGSTRKLFNFFIDELAFFDADLLGKTETEAHQLHHARTIAYIQS